MDIVQKLNRINVMLMHEASQSGAVLLPIMGAQMIGFALIKIKITHHPIGHFTLNLIEKAHMGGVERIVEVKDPGGNVLEMFLGHEIRIERQMRQWKT